MSLTADEKALIQEAIGHLRRLGIVEVHRPKVQAVIVIGYRCKICGSTWSDDTAEIHNPACILDGSQTC